VAYYAKKIITAEETSGLSTDENGYVLYTEGDTKVLVNYEGTETSLTLPEGITEIGQYAFYNHRQITSVLLPDSVTKIGAHAFAYCVELQSMTIPASVTEIGNHAFYNCTGLKELQFSEGLTAIGEHAFYYCTAIESVTFPDSLKKVGVYAFSGCAIKEVYVPSLQIWCSIGFEGWWSNPVQCGATVYIDGKTLSGDLVIPEGTTEIGAYAFYKMTSLTSVTFPESLTKIGEGVFYGCTGLTEIVLPAHPRCVCYATPVFADEI
jgi:hypothetical protein